jgi:hypothetical protein
MPEPRRRPTSALTSLVGRGILIVFAGTVAASQIVGCTVDMEDSSSTGGSGGTSIRSVAGAGGGAASAPGPSDAGPDAQPARR